MKYILRYEYNNDFYYINVIYRGNKIPMFVRSNFKRNAYKFNLSVVKQYQKLYNNHYPYHFEIKIHDS